jgi:YegS/Rv2252/BmrU family lipid kinase
MRIHVIHNPHSVSADRIRALLAEADGAGNWAFELHPSSDVSTLQRDVRNSVREKVDRIVIAGGDGTISQVVQALAPDFSALEIAILPFGTGNDFARSLGLAPDLLGLAATYALGRRTAPIDLIRISGDVNTYCVNVANGGFGGRVAADLRLDDKQRWGAMAYWMTSVLELTQLTPFDLEVVLDGQRHACGAALGLAIANGRFVGGGFPIAPNAVLDDGLLDVILVPVLAPFELLTAGIGFTLGFDPPDIGIQSHRARRIELRSSPGMPFSVDGELYQCQNAAFELIPRALRVAIGDFPAAIPDFIGEDAE